MHSKYFWEATKGALMAKSDWIMIATVAVLGVAIYIAIGVLTVMGASEYIVELAIAMFFVTILVGSYLFVITPQKQREERDPE